VRVDYSAWRPDGSLYDSSILLGKPIDFTLNLTVPAFTEACQMMAIGEKMRLWVPEEMASLESGKPVGSDLVFDVELLSFVEKPVIPPDVSMPPRDAVVTESGLATKVITEGTGTRHPEYGERIVVHYAGWTRSGETLDATYKYGGPATITIDSRHSIGWNEGVRMMVVGEKRRLWIPEDLAYEGGTEVPEGMVVYDVELLDILGPPAEKPQASPLPPPPSSGRRTLPTRPRSR
jgi:FKBP-type peptidyl-prolyl cis-trans isomerase